MIYKNGIFSTDTITEYEPTIELRNLPDRYEQVEYIQNVRASADAGSCINTGYTLPTNLSSIEIVADFQCSNQPGSNFAGNMYWIYGTYSSSSIFGFVIGRTRFKDRNLTAETDLAARSTARGQLNYSYTMGQDNDTIILNGTTYNTPIYYTTLPNMPIYLFATNYYSYSNGYGYSNQLKLYSFTLKIDGTLVRDFVPCYDTVTNKAGMYDMIGNTFYPSSNPNYDFTYDKLQQNKVITSEGEAIFSNFQEF